ncbi:mycothiol transferase [Cellulomonas wangleii]|uniref:mycothiol transferase n=1 Tax=Cellulomonas wangleii TaxID=2816956 RepID=UPI001FB251FD|nr:DUF664 domain-containing protein [Cellulomonas wangleii]
MSRDSLWVTEQESYADVVDGYERACRHADATIDALPIDATGYVPWWPQPDVTLPNVMVHVLTETSRPARRHPARADRRHRRRGHDDVSTRRGRLSRAPVEGRGGGSGGWLARLTE